MELLNRVLTLTDALRLNEENGERSGWYKEWFHFCVLGPDIRALINFSLMSDPHVQASEDKYRARVTYLVEEAGAWDGDIAEVNPRDVSSSPGRIDLRFGHNYLMYREGVFYIGVTLDSRPLTLNLQIRPLTFPLLRSRASIGPGVIDWLVIPRLEASGTIAVDRHVYRLNGVPAYHDHNWGSWLWGHDFAWQWGFVLPAEHSNPWSLVFECMTDHSRTQVQQLKLCLWKGDRLRRVFAQQDVSTRPNGYLSPGRVKKFPRVMSLISPQLTTDVPRNIEIEAVNGEDHLSCCFEAKDIAQLVIPNETDLGETIINEVVGRMQVEGCVKGEEVRIDGGGIFEFLT